MLKLWRSAVEAAKKNALENGLTNCDFIAGDVLKVIDEIEEKPDYIVLDPPRDGIHPKALDKIIAYGVDSMILYFLQADQPRKRFGSLTGERISGSSGSAVAIMFAEHAAC